MILIEKIVLPLSGIEQLQLEASAEDYDFIATLVEEWANDQNRFDGPGEVLCGHLAQGVLVAVGALGMDPYCGAPEIGRIRKVYVRRAWRNKGIGGALVAALVERAQNHFQWVRLRAANAEAGRLYERLGFAPVDDPNATHIFQLRYDP